ncbi:Transcription elongation factor 1 [Homalodisca vitripennis]|nr:Transcription elongation factor 1 [Homalodisca vitripennis]
MYIFTEHGYNITNVHNCCRIMGRRKSNRKPPPKRKAVEPLDIQFNCPFCNHEKSCEVTMYLPPSARTHQIKRSHARLAPCFYE